MKMYWNVRKQNHAISARRASAADFAAISKRFPGDLEAISRRLRSDCEAILLRWWNAAVTVHLELLKDTRSLFFEPDKIDWALAAWIAARIG